MANNCSDQNAVYSFGVCIPEVSCTHFTKIPREHQCEFVRQTPDCLDDEAFIQYMEIFACNYNDKPGEIYVGLLIVITEVSLLFLVLGTTADNFFSPSLCALSNALGMSENIAGVTLLAFGNASPDIFTSLAGATFLGPEIVECQLLGGGIFVTSIVASSILLTRNFYANPSAFVRDTVFFMAALIWMRIISSKSYLMVGETVVLMILYILYVVVVIVDAIYQKRQNKGISSRVSVLVSHEKSASLRPLSRSSKTHFEMRKSRVSTISPRPSPTNVNDQVVLPPPAPPRRRAVSRMDPLSGLVVGAERLSVLNTAGLKDDVERERQGHVDSVGVSLDGELVYKKQVTLWSDFVSEVNPIDDEDWASSGPAGRVYILLKAPIIYLFKYIIPVVDQGAMNNGWCKLLNTIHIVVAPMFMCLSLKVFHHGLLISLTVGLGILVVCIAIAIAIFKTTEVTKPPPYHIAFAIMGFITAMNMIYSVSHELVSLLNVTGYLCNISIATLAMTFLAYGNSVGDMVSNTALARAGYPRMAWAGCFGSPLLSALLGNGISLTFLIEKQGTNHVLRFHNHFSGLITNCFCFLIMSLGSSLLIIPAMGFQCRRSYATFLIFLYAMFLTFSVMCEYGVIHALGA